jgi:hypothetical protein
MASETVVRCSIRECGEPAVFKIAAPWTDGRFRELKTYGFACAEHVRDVVREAEVRWLDYEPVKGEAVHQIGVYRYEPGKLDRELQRDHDIEETLSP